MIECVCCIKCTFDRSRKRSPLKTGSGQELQRLHNLLQQHTRALKASEEYSIETYLTAAIELKLDEGTRLRWTEHSSKCDTTPPCEELLEVLDMASTTP